MRALLPRGTAAAVGRRLTPEPLGPLAPGHSLVEFARSIGYPLAAHQAAALTLQRRLTAIVAPRQAGKSRAVSVLALHRVLEQPGLHVLIVSAGEAAAKRVLDLIARMALEADPSGAQLGREPTHELIVFTNGSQIRCVPPTQRRIRGWTVDLLIIDEAALVDDDVILAAALPTTAARPSARIVLVSSPLVAAGAFYRFVIEGDEGSRHVASHRWALTESPWISGEMVEAARRNMPPMKFAAEYEGEFPESGAGLLIPRPWIRAAQKRQLPGLEAGSFGVDVARSGLDFTTIYRQRDGVVQEIERVNGQDTMATANAVARHMRPIPATPAVIDVVGIGAGVFDRLSEMGLNAVGFNAGWKATRSDMFSNRRAEVYWDLRKRFEAGTIDIPEDDHELGDELASLRYDTVTGGRIAMESKDSIRARGLPSPDRADAIVMALCVTGGVTDTAAILQGSERASIASDLLTAKW